jgi:hypothetical protein
VSSTCLCTLAVHEPYRVRARQLVVDAASVPVVVLTDKPGDFADLPVRAVAHTPTGPMAVDYRRLAIRTGGGAGAAAYHDKRFALMAALEDYETAIFVDADSRLGRLPALERLPPGVALAPGVPESISDHLGLWGPQRRPMFEALAVELFGSTEPLSTARWCSEACFAITRGGREAAFFQAWERAADFFQDRRTYSGEGGVIGLAAEYAGLPIDEEKLADVCAAIRHEAGGPKETR